MKPEGCQSNKRWCEFPAVVHADIVPLWLEPATDGRYRFSYYQDHDSRYYPNAPVTRNERVICSICAQKVYDVIQSYAAEDNNITRYYHKGGE